MWKSRRTSSEIQELTSTLVPRPSHLTHHLGWILTNLLIYRSSECAALPRKAFAATKAKASDPPANSSKQKLRKTMASVTTVTMRRMSLRTNCAARKWSEQSSKSCVR